MLVDLWAALVDWLIIEVPVRKRTFLKFPKLNFKRNLANSN